MRRAAAGVLVLAVLGAAPVLASGKWTTLARPTRFTDLYARGDTVLCGTLETGLLRFERGTGAFEVFSKEPSGVASNHVTAIAVDRRDRLWVGTEDAGVSRLDPPSTSWSLVNGFDGLPSDSITVLRAIGDTLWIGTTAGLALWNGTEIAGKLPDGVNPSPFANNHVNGLVQRGDSVWVSTPSGIYVSRVSEGLVAWNNVFGTLPDTAWTLASAGNELLVLTGQAVARWSDATQSWGATPYVGNTLRLSDSHGVIVAATTQGIYRWDAGAWTLLDGSLQSGSDCFICPDVFAVTTDDSGRTVAANQSGLYLSGASGQPWARVYPPGPPSNNVFNVEVDRDLVWVSTFGDGLGRWDGRQWRLYPPGNCSGTCDTTFLSPSYALALQRDTRGHMWCGSWGVALEEFDSRDEPPSFTRFWLGAGGSDVFHTLPWASAVDSSGGRWFGMDTYCLGDPGCDPIGLDFYDSSATGQWLANYNPGNSAVVNGKIHGLTVDRTGTIWVGYSKGGIGHFRPPTAPPWAIDLVNFDSTGTLDVEGMSARGDDVWALTTDGLYRFGIGSSSQFRATFYRMPDAPYVFAGRPLDIGPDGTVWAGSQSGVRVVHPDGTTEDFNTLNSPLVNDIVSAIRVDPSSGVVWIGTVGGVSRYDPNYAPPPPSPVSALDVKVWPNPGLITGAGLSIRLAANVPAVRGVVYDAAGRRVHPFEVANGARFWDGRDASGALVKPGLYFVRVEAAGKARTVRVALLR